MFIREFELEYDQDPPNIMKKYIHDIISIDDGRKIHQLVDNKYNFKYKYHNELVLLRILKNGGISQMSVYKGFEELKLNVQNKTQKLIDYLEYYEIKYEKEKAEHVGKHDFGIQEIYKKYNLCLECKGAGRWYNISHGEYLDSDTYKEYKCDKCDGTGDFL